MPVRAFVGTCKSGKTYTLQALVARSLREGRGWRFVVLDLNAEWPAEPFKGAPPLRYTVVRTSGEARAALDAGRELVIVQPDGDGDNTERPWAALADELGAAAIDAAGYVCVVLPEAHTSAREHYPLPPSIRTIAHRYRHPSVRAGVWWDTQHFADVSKDLLRASTLIYLFANAARTDLDEAKRLGGPELVAAIEEAGRRALAGEPGWHVRLTTLHRAPPYTLRRA